ncbi:MAG: STAS domain-containing protein [Dechloromonas sp.]|jgi:ABC-type transporter Mla MlaB component|nr:STAS domain-containing protein [Dechloromonas sp.]
MQSQTERERFANISESPQASTAFIARALKEGLHDAIYQSAHQEIEINLSGIGELDAEALRLLISAREEAASHGKRIRFINIARPLIKLLAQPT